MQRLAIALSSGYQVNNLLRTGLLKHLLSRNINILLLTPFSKERWFQKEFKHPNIQFEKLPHHTYSFWEIWFRRARIASYAHMKNMRTLLLKIEEKSNPLLKIFSWILSTPLFANPVIATLFGWLELHFFRDNNARVLLKKYNPDLLFTSPIFLADDLYILKEAKLMGIPTIAYISSWDNLTNKGPIPVKTNWAITWNEINKKQLIKYHGYKNKDITIAGVPQFDVYAQKESFQDRTSFCKEMGLDPSKKIILYGTNTKESFAYDEECIEMVLEFIQKEPNTQLIVRTHPRDSRKYTKLRKKVVFDYTGYSAKNQDPNLLTHNDMRHFAELLTYSDVCITTGSTIGVDAICCNTPCVFIAFDGSEKVPYSRSILRSLRGYEHLSYLLKLGAIPLAKNPEELKGYLKMFLNNSLSKQKERKETIKTHCYRIDGKSTSRIAEVVLKKLSKNL